MLANRYLPHFLLGPFATALQRRKYRNDEDILPFSQVMTYFINRFDTDDARLLFERDALIHGSTRLTGNDVYALVEFANCENEIQHVDKYAKMVDQLVEKYSSNTPFMMAYLSHRLNSHGTNWPPAKDTFKLLMENFNLPAGVAMNASTKRRRLDMTTMPTSSITRTPPLDGEDIAVFALDLARADMVSGSKQFLNRIGYESSPVDPLDFASMLIPLVRSAKDYFSELEEACTVSDIGLVAQMVLAAYVARYVGRRPGNMNDWTYRQAGCGCWDCRQLDQMLSNPTQRVIDFPGRTKKGRQHLHQMLDGVHGITHETERRKNTLVIRKIQGPSQRKDGEWKTRLGEANKQIHEFKNHFSDMPGPLEGLLGQIHDVLMQELQSEPENAFIKLEQKYRELQAKLKELVKPSQSAPLPATSSARPSIPMPVSSGHARPFPIRGVKRKAGPEIIDLTGED